jgi:hypothetical protein
VFVPEMISQLVAVIRFSRNKSCIYKGLDGQHWPSLQEQGLNILIEYMRPDILVPQLKWNS